MKLDDLKAMNLEVGTPIEVVTDNPNVAFPELFNGSFLTYYRGCTDDPKVCCEPCLLHSNRKDISGEFTKDVVHPKRLYQDYTTRLKSITEIRPLRRV